MDEPRINNRAKGWIMAVGFSAAFYGFMTAMGYGAWIIVSGQ